MFNLSCQKEQRTHGLQGSTYVKYVCIYLYNYCKWQQLSVDWTNDVIRKELLKLKTLPNAHQDLFCH